MKVSVIAEIDQLEQSEYGSITAPIYLDWGDYQFPEAGWSDFVVVVLGWWFEALAKLMKGWEKQVEFNFMDGPMIIRVEAIDLSTLRLQCVDQRARQEIVECTREVRTLELYDELMKVAKKVVNACESNKFSSNDLDILKKEIELQSKQLQ